MIGRFKRRVGVPTWERPDPPERCPHCKARLGFSEDVVDGWTVAACRRCKLVALAGDTETYPLDGADPAAIQAVLERRALEIEEEERLRHFLDGGQEVGWGIATIL
jgi:hypothetical protein